MENRPCPIELLISSEYCQLSVCMECRVVNLNLPGRISFQFEIYQFIKIAILFSKAAHLLKEKTEKGQTIKIVEFNRTH
ncbi:MAG: hypothetical protein KAH20_03300 [Methylococcales bacterium]|nr:hypothetical protein [Methylococcales bacterium]